MRRFNLVIFCVALLCAPGQCVECPFGCECFAAARTVKCVFKDLRAVPRGIPGHARTVIVTGNNIYRIGPDSFRELENVTNLILSSNRITEVASHTFSALSNLRHLDLSGNHLSLIHPEALRIPGSPLQELNLSRALPNATSLTDLTTALRWGGLTGLLRLDLSANPLVLLPPGAFAPLPNLRRLLLPNASLASLLDGTFSGLPRLELLDLTHNAMTTLRADALRELGRLGGGRGGGGGGGHAPRVLLSHNPFACDCEILDFAAWLNASGGGGLAAAVVGDADLLRCASPPELRGARLRELGVGTVGGCQEDHQRPAQGGSATDLSLQTSYVLLGLVLGFVGMVFLLVLYLNRRGIKKWVTDIRDACHDVLEGYHYRYEIDSDPRRSVSADGRPARAQGGGGGGRYGQGGADKRSAGPQPQPPSDTCVVQIPSDTRLKQPSISPPVDL